MDGLCSKLCCDLTGKIHSFQLGLRSWGTGNLVTNYLASRFRYASKFQCRKDQGWVAPYLSLFQAGKRVRRAWGRGRWGRGDLEVLYVLRDMLLCTE